MFSENYAGALMSKDIVTLRFEDEDWKRMGIPRKRGGGGLHRNKSEKRRRTRRAELDYYLELEDEEDGLSARNRKQNEKGSFKRTSKDLRNR